MLKTGQDLCQNRHDNCCLVLRMRRVMNVIQTLHHACQQQEIIKSHVSWITDANSELLQDKL